MNLKEKLEELGYTKENFRLEQAIYNDKKNELELLFLYAEWQVLTDEQKKEIMQICKQVYGDYAEVSVKFKGAFIDKEILYEIFQKFLDAHYKSLESVFDFSKVSFVKEDKTICITLNCDKITAQMISGGTFIGELAKFMCNECFYNFDIALHEINNVSVDDLLQKPKLSGYSLSWALDQEKEMNKLEVTNVEWLCGKPIEQKPDFIANQHKEDGEPVVVAGVVSNFLESVYKKKPKNEELEAVEATRISFNLTDASDSVRVIMFPNEKDLEKLRLITDGKTLVLSGNVSRYKDDFSLRARSVSTCDLVSNEIHYCYRGVNDKYDVISPKPWVEVSQMDLFNELASNVSDYLKTNTIVMFDLETTGLDPETCTITEIGAVKIKDGKCVEYFQTLVNPKMPIPDEVVAKTHITDEMVASAPTIDEVMPDFYKFVDGAILSAYNISFDYSFLKKIGHRLRYKFDNEQIDCLDVVRQKVASLPNYKLATVSKYLNIELKNAHRALADALAAAKVFIKLM